MQVHFAELPFIKKCHATVTHVVKTQIAVERNSYCVTVSLKDREPIAKNRGVAPHPVFVLPEGSGPPASADALAPSLAAADFEEHYDPKGKQIRKWCITVSNHSKKMAYLWRDFVVCWVIKSSDGLMNKHM